MFKLEMDLQVANCYVTVAIAIVALLFVFFDVHYFVRVAVTALWTMFVQKRIDLTGKTTAYGISTTNDIDFAGGQMNNARYVRELDFARIAFYIRTGLYEVITKGKGHMMQTACSIRYRRLLPLFTPYRITTKLLYWDDKAIYIEQRFISLNDGFIRAIALSQQKTVGIGVEDAIKKLSNGSAVVKPTPPEDLLEWIKSMQISSDKLRKKD